MNILVGVQILFGLFAIGSGAIVLRGVFRGTLRCKCTVRFLEFSILASIAGLLPLTHRLTPLHAISMLSEYCSGAAVLAWHKFRLAGNRRSAFAFLNLVVLYLNVVSVSVRLLRLSPLFPRAAMQAHSIVYIAQFVFALFFVVLGFLAVRKCHAEPGRVSGGASLATRCPEREETKSSLSRTASRGGSFKVFGTLSALTMNRM